MLIDDYLRSLPFVKTVSLPQGALFYAYQELYEVIDGGEHGSHKARQWRKDNTAEVLLMKPSYTPTHPIILEAHLLPPYASRNELLHQGKALLFGFVTEQNALDAAYLDAALCGQRSGLYVRRFQHKPAFEVTDGGHVYRQYFFMRTNQHIKTELPDIKYKLGSKLIAHRDGPLYWRLLPSWDESPYDAISTAVIRRVDTRNLPEPPTSSADTLPHQPLYNPDE